MRPASKRYRVENALTGEVFGVYPGTSGTDAVKRMLEDPACKLHVGDDLEALLVTELEEP